MLKCHIRDRLLIVTYALNNSMHKIIRFIGIVYLLENTDFYEEIVRKCFVFGPSGVNFSSWPFQAPIFRSKGSLTASLLGGSRSRQPCSLLCTWIHQDRCIRRIPVMQFPRRLSLDFSIQHSPLHESCFQFRNCNEN